MKTDSKTGYIDIHAHILPGVDDGSSDMEETQAMLEKAYEEGVRIIIATPHYLPGNKNMSTERLYQIYEQVQNMLEKRHPDMQLLLGHEIYYRESVIKDLKEKNALTLGDTGYILIEFNISSSYEDIFQAVRKLTAAGYRPIIAHMERYGCLYKREDYVRQLVKAGAYMQINAGSFLRGFFDRRKTYCTRLLQEGLVHFIGSDCHNMEDRPPMMGQTISYLKQKLGSAFIEKMTTENTESLLKNKCIR